MLYNPTPRPTRTRWFARFTAAIALRNRDRQIVELTSLGMSEHLRRDLGLMDGRYLRGAGR